MPGSENFNAGQTLAAMGWEGIDNTANTDLTGPDSSFALRQVDMIPPPEGGQANMPVAPCAISPRVRVTWDWFREQTPNGEVAFMLRCTGCNPIAWGGTSDDWLFKIAHMTTDEQLGQVFTNGDGGINVWNIPGFYPEFSGWKKYRIDVKFSSGFDEPGHDGTRRFGVYPGTVSPPNTDAVRAPTADGEIRIYIGDDIASLALVYSVTGIGVPNPMLLGQTAVPYDRFDFHPEGTIDNIEWEDFCSEGGIPIDESIPCCGSKVDSPSGGTTPGDLAPPNPYIPLPPWTSTGCDGLGTYSTAGNPTEPESWAQV